MNKNKRIVICCDGTWNEPDISPTNVIKIAHHLKPTANNGMQQVVFYDQGVGTGGPIDKYIGGATGKGLEKNVLDAYRFIVHNYELNDEIYLFGFSRGAYTARAVAGLIHAVGILKKDLWEELPKAYEYYRTPLKHRPKTSPLKRDNNIEPKIKMIGVWDTVGSLGAPTPLLKKLTNRWVGFYDAELSPHVEHAYHALALDEKRGPFEPSVWKGLTQDNQQVEQCWFAGVHSDIGGGYESSEVSDISLLWLVEKAEALGLEFDRDDPTFKHSVKPDLLGELHNSYSLPYQLTGSSFIRQVSKNGPGEYKTSIHPSVFYRMQHSHYVPEILRQQAKGIGHERRTYERFNAFNSETKIVVEQKEHPCLLESFSPRGGASISTKLQLKLHDTVGLLLGQQQVNAQCVWNAGNNYGLKF
ncbi:DUF2235 domain-containing protein [Rheinheimera sp.]|uniref:DUF2235 domain-containing protein n=1 Tax=Rheinheimera sp. TaxID=1869214 RepID=UPI00307EC866